MDKAYGEILPKIIPSISSKLSMCSFHNLCEIRFRAKRPLMLYYTDKNVYCAKNGGITKNSEDALIISEEDIRKLLGLFCRSSVYAYQNEIIDGFITINGGHRIGICGTAVVENGKITNIKSFSGLNIRIAREYKGSADTSIPYIIKKDRILNTVIISPPGVGKTTMLRDIARQLSTKFKVSIVDERSEIASCVLGVPQFDVGVQTDVLDAYPKSQGIICALRSLSPDVIITDEIGTEDDIFAVKSILKGGCKIITSMHGYSIDEVLSKNKELMGLFETAILLEKRNGVPQITKCLNL